MASSLPTIILLAGAFADPSCFDSIAFEFQKAGYPTRYATVLSLNPAVPRDASTSRDAQHVRRNSLLPLLDEEKDIIILAHSYGGIVAGAAAFGLSKRERSKEGKAGGIIALLYVAGNIVHGGQSLLQAIGGAYPPFIAENYPSAGLGIIRPAMETLYNDIDSESPKKLQLEAAMIPHALAAFETPAGLPAWAEAAYDGHRAYIRTLDDQTNPLFIQDQWMQDTGVKWDTADIKTGHCPFISQPKRLAELCIAFFEKWAELLQFG
ncbi:hypothetical protein N0V90_001555 [Kalmusia sp. IMI 367209]|nr:hypothetical protein N0V90_001555 [Kalmusia sp. IMI 367209]